MKGNVKLVCCSWLPRYKPQVPDQQTEIRVKASKRNIQVCNFLLFYFESLLHVRAGRSSRSFRVTAPSFATLTSEQDETRPEKPWQPYPPPSPQHHDITSQGNHDFQWKIVWTWAAPVSRSKHADRKHLRSTKEILMVTLFQRVCVCVWRSVGLLFVVFLGTGPLSSLFFVEFLLFVYF